VKYAGLIATTAMTAAASDVTAGRTLRATTASGVSIYPDGFVMRSRASRRNL